MAGSNPAMTLIFGVMRGLEPRIFFQRVVPGLG
jgi:hypothetical protein